MDILSIGVLKMSDIIDYLLSGKMYEFSYRRREYLIQQENNKGYNYLSLWRTSPDYTCLARSFFDIYDGLDAQTVRDIVDNPCIEGKTVIEILEEEKAGI